MGRHRNFFPYCNHSAPVAVRRILFCDSSMLHRCAISRASQCDLTHHHPSYNSGRTYYLNADNETEASRIVAQLAVLRLERSCNPALATTHTCKMAHPPNLPAHILLFSSGPFSQRASNGKDISCWCHESRILTNESRRDGSKRGHLAGAAGPGV